MYDVAGLDEYHDCGWWEVDVASEESWIGYCASGFGGDCEEARYDDECTVGYLESCYLAHRGNPCEIREAEDCIGMAGCCVGNFMLHFGDLFGKSSPP
jgi:hypothetical protein